MLAGSRFFGCDSASLFDDGDRFFHGFFGVSCFDNRRIRIINHCRAGLRLRAFLDLFPFGHALYVQSPTGQPGGQTGILALFADGQRELPVRHHHDGSLFLLEQFHMDRFRRAESVGDEGLGLFVPRYDIYLLALKFIHYALDPVAPDADARADRVDAGLCGAHRDLAAEPSLAGDSFNLNHAVVDFRYFDLEQPFQHVLMASGDQDLRSLGRASNADQIDLGALSLAVALVGRLFFKRQDCLGASQV